MLNEAALLTARSNQKLITNEALDEAIDRVIAGPQRRTRLMSEKEKLITAYHEGGHALVAAALPGTDPVHKITILPRGRALGYTMVLPDEDKYSQTRSQMLDKLAYMLGGRAAEEMVFHDPTTGAGNDIEKATSLARAMVTQYGMTERLGAIKLGDSNSEPFLGRDIGPPAQLLRGRRRDRRRGDQEAPRDRPPGGLRHPRGEPRRPRRAGARAARQGDARQGAGRPDLRAAAPPPRAAGVDRLRPARARRRSRRSRSRRGSATGPRPTANGVAQEPEAEAGAVLTPPGPGGDVHGDPGVEAPGGSAPSRRRRPEPMTDPIRSTERPAADVPPFDHARAEAAVRELLIAIGEDPDREGLRDTPARVARAYAELTAGLRMAPEDVLTTTFDLGHDEMVLVRDIELWSMCEHHLVPFTGVAHVGYIPAETGKITGLSKLARLVDVYAKRPQVQERLTTQVADALMEILEARGVIVVIEAEHLCMTMRGVKKAGARTITSAVRGTMRSNAATRAEAMALIHRSR